MRLIKAVLDISSLFHGCLFFFCISNIFTLSNSQNCRSFGDQLGTCITIRRCPIALRLIESKDGYVTGENVIRLQKITCGFQGEDPKVCCPVNGRLDSDAVEESSLTRHRNFELLPPFSQCGEQKAKISDRIIGGKVPPIGFFPWLARIGYRTSGGKEYFCGGTLISKRYVLTAAHCTVAENESLKPVSIRLGEHKVSEDPDCSEPSVCSYVKDYRVVKIISHQRYNPTSKKHDIALLKLDRDVEYSTFIQPICLPFIKEKSFPDLENSENSGIVAGWGRTRYDRAEESNLLQFVEVPLVSNKRCSEIYGKKTKITDTQLCAGGTANQDSCDGDSGGPLIFGLMDKVRVQRFYQIALVSYGPTKCGTRGLPGIYTRVSEYLKWILDNLES